MECNQISRWLDAYRDKELSKDKKDAVERHLLTCPVCKSRVSSMDLVTVLLQPVTAPATLEHSIRSAISQTVVSTPPIRKELKMKRSFKILSLAACVCTVATVALVAVPRKADASATLARMKKAIQGVQSVTIDMQMGFLRNGQLKVQRLHDVEIAGMSRTEFDDGSVFIVRPDSKKWYLPDGNESAKTHVGEWPVPDPSEYTLEKMSLAGERAGAFAGPVMDAPREINGQKVEIVTRQVTLPVWTESLGESREVIAVNPGTGLPVASWFERKSGAGWEVLENGYADQHMGVGGYTTYQFNTPIPAGTFDPPARNRARK